MALRKKMKGLKIDIREIKPNTGLKWIDYLLIGLLIIVGLCLLPLLIVLWGIGILYNLIFPNRKIEVENSWKEISTGTDFELRYKWTNIDDLPEFIYQHFDPNPLIVFDTKPKIEFFEGYFTDLKVERTDGIFVQKIIPNENNDEIQFLPLYFFNYSTKEIEKIKDLNGYEIDTKGNPNDFMISAIGKEKEFEIRLKKE